LKSIYINNLNVFKRYLVFRIMYTAHRKLDKNEFLIYISLEAEDLFLPVE